MPCRRCELAAGGALPIGRPCGRCGSISCPEPARLAAAGWRRRRHHRHTAGAAAGRLRRLQVARRPWQLCRSPVHGRAVAAG